MRLKLSLDGLVLVIAHGAGFQAIGEPNLTRVYGTDSISALETEDMYQSVRYMSSILLSAFCRSRRVAHYHRLDQTRDT